MHRAIKKTYDVQSGYLPCGTGQQKASGLAASAFNKPAAPELIKDIFEKTRGNGLGLGYYLNARGAAARAPCQFKQGTQPILALE